MSEQGNTQQNSGNDQPQGESRPLSFGERKAEQLHQERNPRIEGANFDGPTSDNINQAALPEQDQQPAHQPDEGTAEAPLDPAFEQDDGTTEQALEEGVETNVESEPEDPEFTGMRQRAEEAESRIQSMQTDYTQKTQKLGESRRELADSLAQSSQISEMYAERAGQNLARYDSVNWQQLQSTLDPTVYSQRVAEYRQAVNLKDRAVAEHERIRQLADTQVEKQKNDQAEISRDILRTTIPNWGNELYANLRTYAVDTLQFTGDEFDNIVDHRHIRMVHDLWKVSNTSATVKGIQHNSQQSRPSGQNMPARQPNGRFRKAQDLHQRNPGDRNAGRNMRLERLQNERRGR